MKKQKAKPGDLFIVPMSDGSFAVGKILWRGVTPQCDRDLQAGIYRLVSENELAAVSVIGQKPLECFYLDPCCFEDKRPPIWQIVGNEPLADYEKGLSRRRVGTNFYFEDEWIGSMFDGRIAREEYGAFPEGTSQLPGSTANRIHDLFGLPPFPKKVTKQESDFPWFEATEWVGALTRSRKGAAVEEALSILSMDYIEIDECFEALTAAEVVATANGAPAKYVPEEVIKWVQKHKDKLDASLVGLAVRAVERIRDNSELQSELNDPDSEHEWTKHIHDLIARLKK